MPCPDDDLLVAFVGRELPPAELVTLEAHVGECTACREVIASLAGSARGTRYAIERELGRGGMGTVYLAHDTVLDRVVALKIHHGHAAPARLYKEAVAMARLAHPNVVTVFEVGDEAGRPFVAMEYVRGGTLRDWMTRERRPWRVTVAMMIDVGAGIAAAHAAGLVHRDFKPENVLVGDDGRPRVSDFGLVQASSDPANDAPGSAAHALTALTMTGLVVGTPAYMAPEQLAGGAVDARCDQFAFCVTLWEALYGQRPFAGDSLDAIMDAIDRRELSPAPNLAVPARMRRVLERGLRKAPGERYASMDRLLDALRMRHRRRRRVVVGIVAIAVAAAAITGSLGYWRGRQQPEPCGGIATHLTGRWDSTRKRAVRDAFAATHQAYGDDAWHAVERTLDVYATRWVAASEDACLDTEVRHTQSVAELVRRTDCLDNRLRSLDALAAALTAADGEVVSRAPQAAGALPSIDSCASGQLLVAPPADPATAARVDKLRDRMAVLGARFATGAEPNLIGARAELVREARAVGFRPLLADALYDQAAAELYADDSRDALAHLEEAQLLAEATRDDALVALLEAERATVLSTIDHDTAGAERALRRADAWTERLGHEPVYEIALLRARANVQIVDAHYADALVTYRRAAALAITLEGAGSLTALKLTGAASNALEALGKYDEARATAQDVLTRELAVLGPHHPTVARAWENLAVDDEFLARYDEAHADLDRAIAIQTEVYGVHSLAVANPTVELGALLLEQHRFAEALPPLRTAATVQAELLGADNHETMRTLSNVALALQGLHQYDEAETISRRVLRHDELEHTTDHPDVADDLANLGALLHDRGRDGDALAALDRALAIYGRVYGDEHRDIATALIERSGVLRATGKSAAARADAARALAIDTKLFSPDHPDVIAARAAVAAIGAPR